MLSWVRPPPHADFASDAVGELALLRAAVAKNQGVAHSDHFKKPELWTASWRRAGQTRGVHKATLVGPEPWLAKCAWCEQVRSSKRELDVEHYRPKVWATEWAGAPPLVSDTPPAEINDRPGYWWLAFAWSNYSLGCKTCNQGWKRNLFPLASPLPSVEGIEQHEAPLLLDPGTPFRTRDHFRWITGSIMEPVSDRGRATIIVCGLNRRELTLRRVKVAHDVSELLDTFLRSGRRHDATTQRVTFTKLARLGARTEEFTGMVRWLVEERLQCAWEDLDGVPS